MSKKKAPATTTFTVPTGRAALLSAIANAQEDLWRDIEKLVEPLAAEARVAEFTRLATMLDEINPEAFKRLAAAMKRAAASDRSAS